MEEKLGKDWTEKRRGEGGRESPKKWNAGCLNIYEFFVAKYLSLSGCWRGSGEKGKRPRGLVGATGGGRG